MKLLCFLLIVSAQQLTWYEHYERGEKSFRRGELEACLADMDAALAVKPEPARNQITRAVQMIDYKPYYYKALALHRLDRLDEAVAAARKASEGEVVGMSPRLMGELVAIFDDHRRNALATSVRYQEERAILDARKQLLDLLARGELDAVDAGLEDVSDPSAFDDIRRQLQLSRQVSEREVSTARQIATRIGEAIDAGDKAMARRFLDELGEMLAADVVADLDARIEALPEPGPEPEVVTETEEPNPEFDAALEEIELYKRRYESVTNDLMRVESQVETLERKNDQLEKIVNEAEASEEEDPPQIAFSPQLFLTVSREGVDRIRVSGHAFSPLPLVDWRLQVDGETVPLPEDALVVDDRNYYLEHHVPIERFGEHEVVLAVVDELRGPEVVAGETVDVPRPFYLEPLLWQSLAVLLIAACLIWMLWRLRARKLARLRHFNPYIAGSPVRREDMFYGRDALIRRIQGLVHKNSFMIHGERRIGKTSLLLQLQQNLDGLTSEDYRFFPVFIDLQGVAEDELFHHMMSEVVARAAGWDIPLDGLAYREEPDGYTARKLARDTKHLVKLLSERYPEHAQIVLLLDEVDCLNAFDEKTNQKLRGIFMKDFADHLTCVMAGIHLKKEWESHGSPWYNFFEEIPVHHIDTGDAESLIVEPVRGIFRYRRDAVRHIIERTGGHPYAIQKVCVSLIESKLSAGRFVIDVDDVRAVLDKMDEEIMRNTR